MIIDKTAELNIILESFRTLENNIFLSNNNISPPKSILFTSALPQEGKSTIIANLAITLSHGGKKVLLIDADIRRPTIHKIFDINNKTGLSDYLSGAEKEFRPETSAYPNLSIIPSGSKSLNPSKLLNSVEIKQLINRLFVKVTNLYDLVLIDSPPILSVVDAALIGPLVDSVILVLSSGQVSKSDAMRAKDILGKSGSKIFGTILNNFSGSEAAYHPYSAQY